MDEERIPHSHNSSRHKHRPRPPTLSEKANLLSFILDGINVEQFNIDEEERANAEALLDSAYIAVFDTYATGCKHACAGKLMSVVWPTEPEYHDVLVWKDGLLEPVKGKWTSEVDRNRG